jgi:DNA transformation protein
MSESSMVAFLLDQLDDPAISARAMFGGHGIYRNGRMFAIVYNEAIYLKLGETEESVDREPFRPRPTQTLRSFREVRADELEQPDSLRKLMSMAIAQASAANGRRLL